MAERRTDPLPPQVGWCDAWKGLPIICRKGIAHARHITGKPFRASQALLLRRSGISLALCHYRRMSRGSRLGAATSCRLHIYHPRYPTDCIYTCTPHGRPVEGRAFCEGPPPWRGPRAPPTKAGAAMWRASEQRQSLGRAIVRRRQWVGKSKAAHAPEGARELIKARASRRKAGEESRRTIERPQWVGKRWHVGGKAIGPDVGGCGMVLRWKRWKARSARERLSE